MSDEEFSKHKNARIATNLEKPKQMHSRSSQIWAEIHNQLYNFNRAHLDVEQLRTVTKEELIEFFKKHVSPESLERRKLSIHIVSMAEGGAGHIDKQDDIQKYEQIPTKITDLIEFKSGRRLHPLPAPYINILVPRKGL